MNVIDISKFKKPKPRKLQGYICLRCDQDGFRILETGAIHCLNCGAVINNLRAVQEQAK